MPSHRLPLQGGPRCRDPLRTATNRHPRGRPIRGQTRPARQRGETRASSFFDAIALERAWEGLGGAMPRAFRLPQRHGERYSLRMALLPCPQCERHVKADETSCPFCHEALSAMSAQAVVQGDGRVLFGSRAWMLFGASAVVIGCGPRAQTAIYGGPPPPAPTPTATASATSSSTAAPPSTAPVAIYGAPAPSDLAPQTDPKRR